MIDPLPRRPWLGARLATDGTVLELAPGAAAQRCGLAVGDRVVAIDGVAVADADAITSVVRSLRVDATLRWRRGPSVLEGVLPCVPRPVERVGGAVVEHGEIAVDGIRQRIIVTRPIAASPSPAVVFLAGSTLDSIDLEPPRPGPLADWTAGLARAGLTTWRVEKRGIGDSEGEATTTDFEAEVAAAREVIACATADSDRAPVVFGHSTGGMIAPRVGEHCAGIVAYGTWAERFTEAMVASLARQRPEAHEANACDAALLHAVIAEEASLTEALSRDPGLRSASALTGSATIWGRVPAYFRQLDRCDLAAAWRRITAPALLLHGDRDRITTLAQHEAIAAMTAAGSVRDVAGHAHDMSGPSAMVIDATVAFVRLCG